MEKAKKCWYNLFAPALLRMLLHDYSNDPEKKETIF